MVGDALSNQRPPPCESEACSFATVRRYLVEIGVPTLIVVGRDDFVTPPSQARILNEDIPTSELIVLERSGHMPWLEEPDAFLGAIKGGSSEPDLFILPSS